jgi:membrane protease YdiL (CAAX protease family)
MDTRMRGDEPELVTGHLDARGQLWEVVVFLFLIVPSMALSFFAVKAGSLGFVLTAFATILRDLSLVSLILYFLWRNGEPVRLIGWTLDNVWREIALAVMLFIPFFPGSIVLERLLRSIGFSVPSTPLPQSMPSATVSQVALAGVLVVVVAISEETIFRGYLLLRFKNLAASSFVAVVLSAFIFSIGHGYEGSAGVVTVGVMGAIFALVYLWRGSLVTPVVMHFLQDFVSIVLAALLSTPK